MQIALDSAKKEFRRLNKEDFYSAQILELLLRVWNDFELIPDDAGWVLWNICDRYAMARDASNQHQYQLKFFDLIKSSFSERLHWVVCDGTQALTLSDGGFIEFWWRCYQSANKNVLRVPENRTVRFEAHRANTAACTQLGEFDRAAVALERMKELLDEDSEWRNLDFANATYMSKLMHLCGVTGRSNQLAEVSEKLERTLDDWLQRVGNATSCKHKEFLFGSWEHLNADRPQSSVFVAIHNAACNFAKTGRFATAERLFRILLDRGRTVSNYGEALFLQSCWQNGTSKNEIIHMLNESMKIAPGYLIQVVPEMADVVG